jgi:hypothetical protein
MKLNLKLVVVGMGNLDSKSEMSFAISNACRSNSQIYILITPKSLTIGEQ